MKMKEKCTPWCPDSVNQIWFWKGSRVYWCGGDCVARCSRPLWFCANSVHSVDFILPLCVHVQATLHLLKQGVVLHCVLVQHVTTLCVHSPLPGASSLWDLIFKSSQLELVSSHASLLNEHIFPMSRKQFLWGRLIDPSVAWPPTWHSTPL